MNPNNRLIWIAVVIALALITVLVFKDKAGAEEVINPCLEYGWCEEITPTPTDYCQTLDGVQAVDEDCPEVTPTVPPAEHGDGLSDNRNDGLGCQSHDCSTHPIVPIAPPNTGRGGE